MTIHKDSYIISFPPGAAGRFVKYLMFNLLTDSKNELKVTPNINSSHPSNRYAGHSFINTNSPDIWNKFVFDIEPSYTGVRLVFSHIFPDFGLIRDRLGPNVKIIIITVDPHSIAEVVINERVKNNYDLIVGKWPTPELEEDFYHNMMDVLDKEYNQYVGKSYPGIFIKQDIIQIGKGMALDIMRYLIKDPSDESELSPYVKMLKKFLTVSDNFDYPTDQLLILPYSDLATVENGNFVWLNKLEKFTNTEADATTVNGYLQYVTGRNNLLKEYRI